MLIIGSIMIFLCGTSLFMSVLFDMQVSDSKFKSIILLILIGLIYIGVIYINFIPISFNPPDPHIPRSEDKNCYQYTDKENCENSIHKCGFDGTVCHNTQGVLMEYIEYKKSNTKRIIYIK